MFEISSLSIQHIWRWNSAFSDVIKNDTSVKTTETRDKTSLKNKKYPEALKHHRATLKIFGSKHIILQSSAKNCKWAFKKIPQKHEFWEIFFSDEVKNRYFQELFVRDLFVYLRFVCLLEAHWCFKWNGTINCMVCVVLSLLSHEFMVLNEIMVWITQISSYSKHLLVRRN